MAKKKQRRIIEGVQLQPKKSNTKNVRLSDRKTQAQRDAKKSKK